MESQHNLLILILLLISFIIWQTWQIDHKQYIDKENIDNHDTRQISNVINNKQIDKNPLFDKKNQFITVQTDVLLLKISKIGGDIEQVHLLTYPDKLNSLQPFCLMETNNIFIYQAQSELISKNNFNNFNNNKRPLYNTTQDVYILKNNQDELRIPLVYNSNKGIIYIKTFIFKRGSFALNVDYTIKNNSNQSLELFLLGQLEQSIDLPKSRHNNINSNFILHTYRGAAYSCTDSNYQKYTFKDIKNNKDNLNIITQSGWIAMLQQYFAVAWIPITMGNNIFYTNYLNNNVIIGFKSSPVVISVGEQNNELKAVLWVGPEIQDKMVSIAPHLDLVVDYGWLWFISQPLFRLLKFIHNYIENWGFSIIIITFIVRCIMYPLTKVQYTAIAKMRMLQPKITAMRERFKDDKQRQSQEIIALYKTEKVNPLGGCLPLIIQMPIFLALYYMLSCSIELRHAPFILWIHDLSSQDPYYILPILMGVTMFFIQKISPTTTVDPIQQKIVTFIPIVFTIFFLWFPSGLVLYYIISNLVTIIQQQIIYRGLAKRGLYNFKKNK